MSGPLYLVQFCLGPVTCRLHCFETWVIAFDRRTSNVCGIHLCYIPTDLRTSHLFESIDACGSGVSNLQLVQRLHILFCEVKVEDVRVGLNPFCGFGSRNRDQATESAFGQNSAYPFCKLHLRITWAQFFLYFSPNRFTAGSLTRSGLARTKGQNAMTRISYWLQ